MRKYSITAVAFGLISCATPSPDQPTAMQFGTHTPPTASGHVVSHPRSGLCGKLATGLLFAAAALSPQGAQAQTISTTEFAVINASDITTTDVFLLASCPVPGAETPTSFDLTQLDCNRLYGYLAYREDEGEDECREKCEETVVRWVAISWGTAISIGTFLLGPLLSKAGFYTWCGKKYTATLQRCGLKEQQAIAPMVHELSTTGEVKANFRLDNKNNS